MPFCPKCRYEYRPEISECPDCATRLVASLPLEPEEQVEQHDWVPIAKMTSPQYAEMIVEALRSKKIPALVSDSSGHFGKTGQMGTSSFQPVGGAVSALFVPREFAADASHEAEVILGEEWDHVKLGEFR